MNESPEPREPDRRSAYPPRRLRRPTVPQDLERFADLDAGLLDDEQAARLLADPRAQAVHAALAATRAELASLHDPPVPAEFAARWDAALAAEAHRTGDTDATTTAPGIEHADSADEPPATRGAGSRPQARAARPVRRGAGPGGRPGTHRPSTHRLRAHRRRPRPALVAATGLAALIAVTALWPRPTGPSLDEVNLATTARESIGLHDVGDLSDPARRTGCLRAVAPPGIPPDGALLGGRRVEFDGRPAALLVLAGGDLGRLHIVIVDPECGPAGGTLLHADTIGQ